MLFSTAYTQNILDSLYNVLNGEWIWYECYHLGETYPHPKNLSRGIIFSYENNSDSITYYTYRNDTLIAQGKTMLKEITLPNCLIINDVLFGGDTINGDFYTNHGVTFVNDTVIWFIVGNGKSAPVYKYKKKESTISTSKQNGFILPNILNIFYELDNIIVTFDKLSSTENLFFKIVDIQGIIVYQQRLIDNGNNVINIRNTIPSGIYLGLLYREDYLLDSEKIMILGE